MMRQQVKTKQCLLVFTLRKNYFIDMGISQLEKHIDDRNECDDQGHRRRNECEDGGAKWIY